jgi:hypothetical protein
MRYRIYEDLPTLSLHRSVRSATVHTGVTEVMAGFGLYDRGFTVVEIMQALQVSRRTVYRYLAAEENA